MNDLTPREKELVALGAAMGSNCVPCIEYHIPAARKAGLSDAQIRAAIDTADRVRQVPARKVLETAAALLGDGAGIDGDAKPASCAGATKPASACCG